MLRVKRRKIIIEGIKWADGNADTYTKHLSISHRNSVNFSKQMDFLKDNFLSAIRESATEANMSYSYTYKP